jgi:subtilase family serine protease
VRAQRTAAPDFPRWPLAAAELPHFAADEALYDSYLTTPAGHQGVTFVASTGDYGTADPEYPAFSPNVVAVGGACPDKGQGGGPFTCRPLHAW